jgi:hypothetical protein
MMRRILKERVLNKKTSTAISLHSLWKQHFARRRAGIQGFTFSVVNAPENHLSELTGFSTRSFAIVAFTHRPGYWFIWFWIIIAFYSIDPGHWFFRFFVS